MRDELNAKTQRVQRSQRFNMGNRELEGSALKEIAPLLPQFLQRRRVGIAAPRIIAEQLGIEPPLLFAMMQLNLIQGSYGWQPISPAQARAWSRYTYSSRDHLSAHLTALKEKKLVRVDSDSCFTLTAQAREAVD